MVSFASHFIKKIILILSFILFVLAFQFLMIRPVKANFDTKKIIGIDDFITVKPDLSNIPFKLRHIPYAVGLLKEGCTVTHIGDGYAITAGHCFWAGPEALRNQKCDSEEYTIDWGRIEGRASYSLSRCTEILVYQQSETLDYALIKVDPIPKAYVALDLDRKLKLHDRFTIFSHPNTEPLAWSKMCEVDRQISSGFSLDFIHHTCDTLPGSSGAVMISLKSLKIIGIHDGGRAVNGVGKNYGTSILSTPIPSLLKKLGYSK